MHLSIRFRMKLIERFCIILIINDFCVTSESKISLVE